MGLVGELLEGLTQEEGEQRLNHRRVEGATCVSVPRGHVGSKFVHRRDFPPYSPFLQFQGS